MAPRATRPVTVIEATPGWRLVDGRELYAWRDLLRLLAVRQLKDAYAQSTLGIGWAVVRPALTAVVFAVVFGVIARVPSAGVPYGLFAFSGLVPWTYFYGAVMGSSESLVLNKELLTKVYFPRVFLPLVPVVTGLVDLAVSTAVLAVVAAVLFGYAPTVAVVALPLFVAVAATAAFGAGMWLAALGLQYRDVRHGVPFVLQVLQYATPIIWPFPLLLARVSPGSQDTFRLVYGLSPMVGVVEAYRAAFLGTVPVPWDLLATGALTAVVLLFTGALVFRRGERAFADVA